MQYLQLVTIWSMKKKGPYTFVLDKGQKTFTFCKSLSNFSVACSNSVPHTFTLWQFTFPDRWKVASLLNIYFLTKSSSSSIACCIWLQQSNQLIFKLGESMHLFMYHSSLYVVYLWIHSALKPNESFRQTLYITCTPFFLPQYLHNISSFLLCQGTILDSIIFFSLTCSVELW